MKASRTLADFAVNALLVLDMAGNCLLLGRPGETVSHRVARMRAFGGPGPHRVGCALCRVLTALFWFMRRDHCAWALGDQPSLGTELWRWSK